MLPEILHKVSGGAAVKERTVHVLKTPDRGVKSAGGLSLIEKEVLQLTAAGFADAEIAGKIFVALRTVRNIQHHINSIAGGLEVKAVVWGINNGEIDAAKAVEGYDVSLVTRFNNKQIAIMEAIIGSEVTTNKGVDSLLGFSRGTSRRQVPNMLNLTGVRNKCQLAVLYLEAKKNGILGNASIK